MKTKAFDHQNRVVDESWHRPAWALFLDTGVGKTRIVLDTAERLYLAGKITGVLVIAPSGVYRNISDIEIPKHLSVPHRVAVWKATISAKAKQAMMLQAANRSMCLEILCLNTEAFSFPKSDAVKLAETFLTTNRCLLVIDESTQIKIPSSTKTKTILRLSKLAAYRRVLSGMPVTESPENLYTQLLCLGCDHFGYNSFYAFRNRFCTLEDKVIRVGGRLQKFQKVTGARRQAELNALITSMGHIIHKSECLDLPAKVYQRRTVEMSKEQAAAYAAMKREAGVTINHQEVSALNVLGILEKQHQIVCGFLKTEDKTIWFDDTRINALLEQLEETQGKVIIWTHYKACIARIAQAVGKKYGTQSVATFSGDTTSDQRPNIISAFQNGSEVRFLIANPATGKFSWTLTSAHTAIYYSNSYKLEDRYQSEDRLHRIGQNNQVTYIDLVTPGTVDEQILNALREKRNIAAEIMQWREMLAA
jgi:hypothetical protein